MPDQTEHRTPPDLPAVRRRLGRFRCHEDAAGADLLPEEHAAAIACAEDVEPLLDELEQLRHDNARWAWRAGLARGALSRVVALIPEGKVRDQARLTVEELDRELQREAVDRAAAGGGAGNPATEGQPPPAQPATEVDGA